MAVDCARAEKLLSRKDWSLLLISASKWPGTALGLLQAPVSVEAISQRKCTSFANRGIGAGKNQQCVQRWLHQAASQQILFDVKSKLFGLESPDWPRLPQSPA